MKEREMEIFVSYTTEELITDLEDYGVEVNNMGNNHYDDLRGRIYKTIEKSDLYDRINEVISEFVSEWEKDKELNEMENYFNVAN